MRSTGLPVAFIIPLHLLLILIIFFLLTDFAHSRSVISGRITSVYAVLSWICLDYILKELTTMKNMGYIKDYRSELESDLWQMPPLYHRVWQFLKYKANHAEKKLSLNDGSEFTIGPGQHITSLRAIANGVSWKERGKAVIPNVKTIDTVLKWLQRSKLIRIDKAPSNTHAAVSSNSQNNVRSNTPGSLITLLLWEFLQTSEHESNSKQSVTGISESSHKVTKQEVITTTTTQQSHKFSNHTDDQTIMKSISQPLKAILVEYACLHKRLLLNIRSKERESMAKMISGGIPSHFIIAAMTQLYEEKKNREQLANDVFQPPSSFIYYENAIWGAWKNQNTESEQAKHGGSTRRGRTRQPQTAAIAQNQKEFSIDEDDEITRLMRKASCD